MNIQRKIYAKTPGMALLYDGRIAEIGGLTEEMEAEFSNGSIVKVICLYFNLQNEVNSTDFFLFEAENRKLISYSVGKKTHPFFRELYRLALSDSKNHNIQSFLDEFVGDYISHGLMGDFPSDYNKGLN